MTIVFKLHFKKDASFVAEAMKAFQDAQIEVQKPPGMRGAPTMDIIIALGSAGAFTALYQVINKLLDKNKGRTVKIERGKTKVSLTGYSLPEVKELMEQLAPELLKHAKSKKPTPK